MFKVLSFALFSSALFFLSTSIILATSGCCSSHDGVNCAAGSQANGNVICNDGSRTSSCSYSSMVECRGSSLTTTIPQSSFSPLPIMTPKLTTPTPVIPSIIPSSSPTIFPTPLSHPLPSPSIVPVTVQSGSSGSSGGSFIGGLVAGGVGGYYLKGRRSKKPKDKPVDNLN